MEKKQFSGEFLTNNALMNMYPLTAVHPLSKPYHSNFVADLFGLFHGHFSDLRRDAGFDCRHFGVVGPETARQTPTLEAVPVAKCVVMKQRVRTLLKL